MLYDRTDIWIGTDSGLFRIKIDNPLAHWTGKLKPARTEKQIIRKRK